ncbi:acyltransferase [Arthrobacter gandavensis]|uniref:acyltransferase family protein n=1 Tax=Arthrobacter gandavensis TaxID=169960 RepID=UPI0018902F1C|nr:acyltransferase family protein [Arthrobacter gandavensis]MBF4993008.1 acyltransferase [Arthrobacter gandavensis]
MKSHALSGATVGPAGSLRASRQRRDIQGLRALAVVAVILNHLFEWPAGGFVGVDVFFVISGFLISGLLVREVAANGRIDFAAFYVRRARRILPMALLVVLVTVAATYLLYNSARGASVRADGIFAALFAANWHFAAVGTDYWQTDGVVSPLQHYWSLAVEEQFYLFWPWLIIAAAFIGMRAGRRSSTGVTAALMTLVAAASFGYALWQVTAAPTWAYFSTFTRTWELAAGALAALALPFCGKLDARLRSAMAVVGLVMILASLFVVHPDSGIPAPGAALPVLGAVLVIAGGTGHTLRSMLLLTNPVSQYLGRISYSLYLWHFPAIVLLRVFFPDSGTGYAFAVLSVTSVLSVLSFHLVEDPIRRSGLFGREGTPQVHYGRRGTSGGGPSRWKSVALAGQGVFTAALAVILLLNPAGFGASTSSLAAPATAMGLPQATTGTGAATNGGEAASTESADDVAAAVSAALAAETFPEFSPSVESLGTSAWINEVNSDGCAEITASNFDGCAQAPPTVVKTVAVLGDSYAIAWMPGIREAAEAANYRVVPLTKGQCPAAAVQVTRDGGTDYPECGEHREWALTQIREIKPDLLVIADADNTLSRLASGSGGDGAPSAVDEVEAGLSETIAAVQGSVGEVLLLAPPPSGRNLQDCVTRVGSPDDCVSNVSDQWRRMQEAQKGAAASTGARYVATDGWFCDVSGACPGFVGSTPVRVDTSHITPAYSRFLAPVLQGAISG